MDLIKILQQNIDNSHACIYTANEASEKYGQTTFSTPVQLDAAITVKQTSAISTIITLANKFGFHLFPISTGNNWGYGSIYDSPLSKPKVLLDLGYLKKITPVSKELGLITVEPGVTQQMLYEYLEQHKWPFMTPVTGAGPNCSILSNALERGYGITPKTDHFMAVNALKAYLPHPDLCQTIFTSAISELDGTGDDFIDKTYKWGLGPYIDGLFTQSNLGIVTEVTIRLAPKPKYFCSFYLKVTKDEKFESCVILIREFLKDYEGIIGSINLMDKSRLISMSAENPNGTEQHVNMSEAQITKLASQNQLPEWMVVGSIYGTKSLVQHCKLDFKKRAKNLGTLYFSDSLFMKSVKKIISLPLPQHRIINDIRKQLKNLDEGIEIMLGKPNQIALPLAYWRNPRMSADKTRHLLPAKDKCGLLWYAPLLPMSPEKLRIFVNFVRQTTPKYGIEPLITFTNLRHDCIDSTVPIVFNLLNEQAVKMAHQCLNELITVGQKMGFIPYRMDTKSQNKLDGNTMFWKTTAAIKHSLDPNNIISPNRYNP